MMQNRRMKKLFKGLKSDAADKRLANVGAEPMPFTTEEFADYLKSETAQVRKLMCKVGIRAD